MAYVSGKGKPIHHQTLDTVAWLRSLPENSGRSQAEAKE